MLTIKFITFAVICIAFIAPLFVMGCRSAGSTTPPTPQTVYQKAAVGMDDFATALSQFQNVIITLHTNKIITDSTNTQIETVVSKISSDAESVDSLIASGADTATIQASINAVIADLNTLIAAGKVGISDPTSQAEFTTAITAIQSVFQVVEQELQ